MNATTGLVLVRRALTGAAIRRAREWRAQTFGMNLLLDTREPGLRAQPDGSFGANDLNL